MENPSNTSSCQICLGQLELPINLFESSYSGLLDVLQLLLTFQVYVEGKEFIVCRHCQEKLILISEFQTICLQALEPFRNLDSKPVCFTEDIALEIKTERCISPVIDLVHLNNSEVRLTRCPKVDEILSRKRKTRPGKSSDKPIADLKNDKEDESPFGDNSDGDSDYEASDDDSTKERKCKRVIQTKNRITKPCRSVLEKFTYNDVLQAIQEVHSAGVRIMQCIFCAFVGKRDQIVFHMARSHKNVDDWCKYCNIQVEDLPKHRDTVRCHMWTCKFCDKTAATTISHFTKHVKLHCNTKVADVPLRLKQYPADKVLQAIKEIRFPADGKRRQCPLCHFVGEEVIKVKIHMVAKHNTEFRKWCTYCNTISEDLQKHRDDDKCYGEHCKFCDQTFEKVKSLSQHLRQHCRKELFCKVNGSLMPLEESPSNKSDNINVPHKETDLSLQELKERNSSSSCNLKEECLESVEEQPKAHLDIEDVDLVDQQIDSKDDLSYISCFNDDADDKRSSSKQFPYAVVLQAINEVQSYCINMKNRQCILCNFIGGTLHSLSLHMKLKHKDMVNWCKNCNNQVEDLQAHSDVERCHIWTCKLCSKTYQGMRGLTTHIKTHCHSRVARVHTRLQDFPVYEVLEALREIRFPVDVKRRKCVLCDFSGREVCNLNIHMSTKHKAECDSWCKYCNTMSKNLQKHRDDDKCYGERCKFCGTTFGHVKYLRQHLKQHCRRKKCKTCKEDNCKCSKSEESQPSTGNKKLRNRDSKSKSEVKNGLFDYCTVCAKHVVGLKRHMIRKHNAPNDNLRAIAEAARYENKKHLCPTCGKIFKSKSGLDGHIESHNGVPKFQCITCGKSFYHRGPLRVHEGYCNGKQKPFVCLTCGKKTLGKASHMRHLDTHHEGGPVQCTICNTEFHRPGLLKLHMRRHTGENQFHCIPCGKSYYLKSRLNQHMEMHKNDDDRPHICTVCGKGFKGKETLQGHKRIHTGVKPYKCSVCPYRCIQAHALTTHMKQHPEDAPQASKPHKCPFCYRSFSTNALLSSHIDNFHSYD